MTTPDRKILTPELKARVDARIRECLDIATAIWPDHAAKFQDAVTVRYDVKNHVGGWAITGGPDDWTIRLNPVLCFENVEHFIVQTVGHEAAHLITGVVFGRTKQVEDPKTGKLVTKKIRGHGAEWRSVMVKLGLKPDRCHTYDCSSIEIKKKARAKRGAPLTPTQVLELMKRLELGIKRLPREAQEEFGNRCLDIASAGEDDGE